MTFEQIAEHLNKKKIETVSGKNLVVLMFIKLWRKKT